MAFLITLQTQSITKKPMKKSLNILQSYPNGANKIVYRPAFFESVIWWGGDGGAASERLFCLAQLN